MTRVRIKICGIRSLEEARLAQELGVDALGFNFWEPSPRYIDPADAMRIVRELNPFVASVGVFVNQPADRVREIHEQIGLSAVQLHGDESPDYCSSLAPLKAIKAFRIRGGFDPASVKSYPVTAVLLDAGVPGYFGGTGQSFDWRVALDVKQYAPVALAGGLTAQNVAEAVRGVRPWAIDVCSGVETEPGRKDFEKMKRFMAEVDSVNSLLAAEGAGNS
jgi:phosphoribosylanthranilate isomerase